jgi:chromosome partitioning protein
MFVYYILGQKGGGSKTATACSLGTWHAQRGKAVFFGDTDTRQHTLTNWLRRRKHKLGMTSFVGDTRTTIANAIPAGADIVIIDGKPNASAETLLFAKIAHKIIIPTGSSIGNLEASAAIANQLVANGIDRALIVFAVTPAASPAHAAKAVDVLQALGHTVGGTLQFSPEFETALDAGRGLHEASNHYMREAGQAFVAALV